MEPLALLERRLHPQVCGARQNAFCERQNALYIEFIELPRVTVNPDERELLAQFLRVAVVGVDVDRALEKERLVETVQLVLVAFAARSAFASSSRTAAFRAFQMRSTDSLSSRM